MLLADARKEMFQKAYDGVICPCCDQRVQVYKRTITSAMAYGLILTSQHCQLVPGTWLHIPSFFADLNADAKFKATLRGDFAKLRYWGFVDEKNEDRADGSDRNGHYRITPAGEQFVLGTTAAPKHAYVYNQRLLGMSDGQWGPAEYISIQDALGQKFNYNQLMGYSP